MNYKNIIFKSHTHIIFVDLVATLWRLEENKLPLLFVKNGFQR